MWQKPLSLAIAAAWKAYSPYNGQLNTLEASGLTKQYQSASGAQSRDAYCAAVAPYVGAMREDSSTLSL
jgi:hypothetical protein